MRTLLSKTVPTPAQDLALLAARVVLGVVLIAHGWQKLDQGGFAGTADGFTQMGIPAPGAAAFYAIAVELVGGALLVAGLATRLVSVLVIGDMFGAFWFAHRDGGVFVTGGGWELVALIAAVAAALVARGAGRVSVDALVTRMTGTALAPDSRPAREPAPAGTLG